MILEVSTENLVQRQQHVHHDFINWNGGSKQGRRGQNCAGLKLKVHVINC